MAEKTRAHLFISGRVQGVYFRENTQKKAKEFSVFGWVRNFEDGKVEAIFEGEKENVEKIIEWAKRGPELASVDGVDVEWQEFKGEFENFEIRHF